MENDNQEIETFSDEELKRQEQEAVGLTEDDLNPKNWAIEFMETDCGHACTPNGCMGHTSSIFEALEIGGYRISLDSEIDCETDAQNRVKIAIAIRELLDFWTAAHPGAADFKCPDCSRNCTTECLRMADPICPKCRQVGIKCEELADEVDIGVGIQRRVYGYECEKCGQVGIKACCGTVDDAPHAKWCAEHGAII